MFLISLLSLMSLNAMAASNSSDSVKFVLSCNSADSSHGYALETMKFGSSPVLQVRLLQGRELKRHVKDFKVKKTVKGTQEIYKGRDFLLTIHRESLVPRRPTAGLPSVLKADLGKAGRIEESLRCYHE